MLYLAYGSKTFLGKRGIKPISLINVYVPELRFTFGFSGVPYSEPCFASTRYRHDPGEEMEDVVSEKAPLWGQGYDDERTAWHRPLIGVVYEITLKAYTWIITTEAGGRRYNDGIVTCYPFTESYDPADEAPEHPSTQPFKARSSVEYQSKAIIMDPLNNPQINDTASDEPGGHSSELCVRRNPGVIAHKLSQGLIETPTSP